MSGLADAFWRAALYCLHWRAIAWSLVPLLLAAGMVFGLGWAYWEPSVAGVRAALERWELLAAMFEWLDSIGAKALRTVLAPMLVVAVAVPVVLLGTLLLVSWVVAPAMAALVAQRRFPTLERDAGAAGRLRALAWSLACTAAALVALALSIPLWFVPPLVLLLPPLIWGWLACRVLAFDVLALHAAADERRHLLHARRWPLRAAGVVCGYLAAAPALIWTGGAATLVLAPWLMMAAVWLYTGVFVFASLWFAHYLLTELDGLRRRGQYPSVSDVIDHEGLPS